MEPRQSPLDSRAARIRSFSLWRSGPHRIRRGRVFDHLRDLQVGRLSEQELTTILQMLQKLCQHVGANVDATKQEVQSFSQTTDVRKLASELQEKLPGEQLGDGPERVA